MARKYINSRADFFDVLDQTMKEIKQRVAAAPGMQTWDVLDMQLDAMRRWTQQDRAPTQPERDRITIGTIAVRELEPAHDVPTYELTQRLHELNGYFVDWPPDKP